MRHRGRHLGFAFGLLFVSLVAPTVVDAKPPPKSAKLEAPPRRLLPSKSVGSPTDGRLIGGSRLSGGPHIRIVPVYTQGDARWGVDTLVSAIDRAARAVRKRFPDAVLSVGDLSKPGGGGIDRHASHESGRDADIGFYVKNERGKPVYADHFVSFKGDGTAPSWPGAHFDDARNWELIAALVGQGRARITHIFVSTPIRQRLLAYAAKIGAPRSLRVRASELMAQPRGSQPHDDHFHVRVACSPGMDKCIERPMARRARKAAEAAATAKNKSPNKPAPQASRPPPSPRRDRSRAKPAPPAAGSDATTDEASETDTEREEESAKADASFPSLAPIVPGLDSVVIPKPLEMPRPRGAPIDDPDGVLEPR